MARRVNELFIGRQHLTLDGPSIKHPSLIAEYGNLNMAKVSDNKIDLLGLDLETDSETGELRLLGLYDGEKYRYYLEDFLQVLFKYIKQCSFNNVSVAYWNKLDPFVIFKQFLYHLSDKDRVRSMTHYGKISGVWDKKNKTWKVKPVVILEIGNYYFGIKNVIRSSIQFFINKKGSKFLNTVWAYDIAQLYEKPLEKEMLNRKELFPYYSKIEESAHIIDWDRFNTDKNYRYNIVLKSNEYDARAVYDLGVHIQDLYYKAFKYYPRYLISTGTLARASLVATTLNKYNKLYPDNSEKAFTLAYEDIKSISIMDHYDNWYKQIGNHNLIDLYCLMTESYSGGYIESFRYGFSPQAFYSDIASAYPFYISQLYDLRDSTVTTGIGEPPHIKYSYCFIRGTVNIPLTVNYHPITIKHPLAKATNIRAVGEYIASYTIEERDYLLTLGATFSNETWYNIETKGKLSPIADVVREFLDLRAMFLKNKDSAQYMAKISANSMYGILFECVDTWGETDDEVYKLGYRGGEFWNPCFASYITGQTRIMMSKANNCIVNNGGKPILTMTDSTFWTGGANMLDSKYIKDVKTVGYFETVKEIKNFTCLGVGRYSFSDLENNDITSKKRGLNVVDFHDPDGIILIDSEFTNKNKKKIFNWVKALKILEKNKDLSKKIIVDVRKLISVGVILNNSDYNFYDLGRIITEKMEVDLLVGGNKRFIHKPSDPTYLCDNMIDTSSLYLGFNMGGDMKLNDQTLPHLRELILQKQVITTDMKTKQNKVKAQMRYSKKQHVKDNINKQYKLKYNRLRQLGYNSYESNKMSKWSNDRIIDQLKLDNKYKEVQNV